GAILTLSGAGRFSAWDPQTLRDHDRLGDGFPQLVTALAFTPDGKRLLTAGRGEFPPDEPELRVWDAAQGVPLKTLQGRDHSIHAVAFSPDGATLAATQTRYLDNASPGVVGLWDVRTGQRRLTLQDHRSAIFALAYSPDGALLASAGGNPLSSSTPGEVRLWHARTGKAVRAWTDLEGAAASVAFSADGKRLVVATASLGQRRAAIRVLDVESGRVLASWAEDTGQVMGVAFDRDGKTVLGVIGDLAQQNKPGLLKLGDAATGKVVTALPAHRAMPSGLAMSPDGKTAATCGFDGAVLLWDLETRKSRAFATSDHPVASVQFSPDGQLLAAAG